MLYKTYQKKNKKNDSQKVDDSPSQNATAEQRKKQISVRFFKDQKQAISV